MKARRSNKPKTWFSICREKPQTIDSDSSDREIEENKVDNRAENKVRDKVKDGVESKVENRQRNITPTLSKIYQHSLIETLRIFPARVWHTLQCFYIFKFVQYY